MPIAAANPAALLLLSPCRMEMANEGLPRRKGGGEARSADGVFGCWKVAAMARNFRGQDADENFAPACVCRFVSRLLHGHCFGAYPAPCGSSLFCFGCAALRVTVSLQILFAKFSEKISPEPP